MEKRVGGEEIVGGGEEELVRLELLEGHEEGEYYEGHGGFPTRRRRSVASSGVTVARGVHEWGHALGGDAGGGGEVGDGTPKSGHHWSLYAGVELDGDD